MELLVALLLVIFGSLLLYFRNVFNYWNNLGVAQFPVSFPSGNVKGMMKKYHLSEFMVKYYQKTKKIGARFCGIYMFTRPSLLVADLDLIKMILVKDFNVFPNRGMYHNERDDPISAHLFNLENDPWRQVKKIEQN